MIGEMPKFINSPYFVDEPGNWHLKPGAPQELVDEFNSYMKSELDSKEKAKSFSDVLTERS